MAWRRHGDDDESGDADVREDGLQQIERLRHRGELFEVVPAPASVRKVATTFWGQAWCRHLEGLELYAQRLQRGRAYLRQGRVFNLRVEPGRIAAVVAGAAVYETVVQIKPLPAETWEAIVEACGGRVGSLLDLLAGRLSEEVLRVMTAPESGIFPGPDEIRFVCSCPDDADLCKHSAAVLYALGPALDARPELLFTLRQVDQNRLMGQASRQLAAEWDADRDAGQLEDLSLGTLFGIDLQEEDSRPSGPIP